MIIVTARTIVILSKNFEILIISDGLRLIPLFFHQIFISVPSFRMYFPTLILSVPILSHPTIASDWIAGVNACSRKSPLVFPACPFAYPIHREKTAILPKLLSIKLKILIFLAIDIFIFTFGSVNCLLQSFLVLLLRFLGHGFLPVLGCRVQD